jgi:hypothetical protein
MNDLARVRRELAAVHLAAIMRVLDREEPEYAS